MQTVKTISGVVVGVGVILAIFAVMWVVQGNNFLTYKVFGVKYENQRREIFEQSKAYNQGMIQELQNMQFQYEQSSPDQKDALAAIILHRVADYPNQERMPNDLQEFIAKLQRGNR